MGITRDSGNKGVRTRKSRLSAVAERVLLLRSVMDAMDGSSSASSEWVDLSMERICVSCYMHRWRRYVDRKLGCALICTMAAFITCRVGLGEENMASPPVDLEGLQMR